MAKKNNIKNRFPDYVTSLTFHTVNDHHVCIACQELAEKVFTIIEAPSLPYNKCTNPKGCRCWVTPIVDENEFQKRLNKIFPS